MKIQPNQISHSKSPMLPICRPTALALLIVTLWPRVNTSEKLLEFVSCPYHARTRIQKQIPGNHSELSHHHIYINIYIIERHMLVYLYKYV